MGRREIESGGIRAGGCHCAGTMPSIVDCCLVFLGGRGVGERGREGAIFHGGTAYCREILVSLAVNTGLFGVVDREMLVVVGGGALGERSGEQRVEGIYAGDVEDRRLTAGLLPKKVDSFFGSMDGCGDEGYWNGRSAV